jgi:hypothetical protein
MSNDKTPSPGTDGGQTAVDYVNQQLESARTSLGRTKLVAIIMILLVLSYMTFVTKGILGHLEPKTAAETAKGLIAEQLTEKGDALANSLKERIPAMMHDLPDTVLARIPTIRQGIEDRVEGQLRNYAAITAKELDPMFEEFLTAHKDDIQSFLDASQNLDELREDLNPDMDKLLRDFLSKHQDGEESLLEKFESSKVLLSRIADQTDRLAGATDLNDREKQTRRAIAVLLAKADFKLYESTRDHDPEDDPDDKTTTTEEK